MGEIEEYGSDYGEYTFNTVYFGGGTPTLLEADELCKLLTAIKTNFKVTEDAEISVECNPSTADLVYLKKLRNGGFNRLSLGVQSMNDGELKLLGRLHRAADAKEAVTLARQAGFGNISVDVMYGIPDQTLESLTATLAELCALDPEHISLYGLKIEDGTHFAKHKNKLNLPDEDTEYEMYVSSTRFLEKMGYEKYEISNFAKGKAYSKHNLKYWLRDDYLGLGLAAHSCIGANRFSNTTDIEKYFSGDKIDTNETISDHDILCEKIMLGMRLSRGVDFGALGETAEQYKKRLENFIPSNHVIKKENTLSFSDDGMYISNYILSETLDFDE